MTDRHFTTAGPTHAHDLGRVPCVICGGMYRDHDPDTLKCPTPLLSVGDRVMHGGIMGRIMATDPGQAHVYFGTADGKPVGRWIPTSELEPAPRTAEQELEDLL
jgi:hypothetical protein